jgi:hypothetical protein
MNIKENVTLYYCDFCKKELKLKHAMAKHEFLCFNNPINHKKCQFGCIHLEKITMDVQWEQYSDYHSDVKEVEVFKCNKLDKLMFPWKIERKKLHEKYETYQDQEPMPKECDSFEEEIFLDIFRNW